MNKALEILIGLILVIGAILVAYLTLPLEFWDFGHAAWIVLKGGVIWAVFGIGLLLLLLGISDLRN